MSNLKTNFIMKQEIHEMTMEGKAFLLTVQSAGKLDSAPVSSVHLTDEDLMSAIRIKVDSFQDKFRTPLILAVSLVDFVHE